MCEEIAFIIVFVTGIMRLYYQKKQLKKLNGLSGLSKVKTENKYFTESIFECILEGWVK